MPLPPVRLAEAWLLHREDLLGPCSPASLGCSQRNFAELKKHYDSYGDLDAQIAAVLEGADKPADAAAAMAAEAPASPADRAWHSDGEVGGGRVTTASVLSGLRGSPGRAVPPKVENEQLRKYIEELRDEVVAEQTTAG